MKKHQYLNLVLFSIIVALALVAWLDPFQKEQSPFTALTSLDAQSVRKISLIQAGKVVFSVEKPDSRADLPWQLTRPLRIPANPLKIKQLLNLANTNSLRHYQIKSENLAKLGLAEPAWQIIFETGTAFDASTSRSVTPDSSADPDTVIIGFGKTEPIQQLRYVLVGNTVHLINDRVSQFNFGSPLMLANLDILPVDKSVMEVHLPDKVIRRVDGQWESTSPAEKSLSQTTYREFIDEWRYAQAMRVALADKNEYNTEAQPVTVILEEAEEPVHFMVEPSGQDYIVTNKDWGVRYYLNSSVGEKLMQISAPAQEQ